MPGKAVSNLRFREEAEELQGVYPPRFETALPGGGPGVLEGATLRYYLRG